MINLYPVTHYHYVILACGIFVIGMSSVLFRKKSILNILMSIELMLLAANINFVAFASANGDASGYVFAIFVLAMAAAEAAIGLAILVAYFRHSDSIYVEDASKTG